MTATSLAAGFKHTCVKLSNQSVVCWGMNNNGQLGIGQLGIGTTVDEKTPMSVPLNQGTFEFLFVAYSC